MMNKVPGGEDWLPCGKKLGFSIMIDFFKFFSSALEPSRQLRHETLQVIHP